MILDQAITLATTWVDRGIPAFPIAIGWDPAKYGGMGGTTKRPLTNNGHLSAVRNIQPLRRLFEAGAQRLHEGEELAVGLWPGPAGRMVLDVDDKGGKRGSDVLADLQARYGTLADHPTVLTPSGGSHRWLLKPDGAHVGNEDLDEGIEVRADDGWVVAPGVETAWGSWVVEESTEIPAPLCPQWIADRLARPASNDGRAPAGRRWARLDRNQLDSANLAALEALEALGGHEAHLDREGAIRVTRPGKMSGVSASIGYSAPGVVHVWTDQWDGLDQGWWSLDGNGQLVPDEKVAGAKPRQTDLVSARSKESALEQTSWAPVDATDLLNRSWQRPEPTQLMRNDGTALFYPGYTNALHGESESGKSWLAMYAAVQALDRGETVVYIDFEQDAADVYGRLRLLGASVDQLADRFRYVHPEGPLDDDGHRDLDAAIDGAALVVIDGITDAMGLHGLSPNDNAEYAEFDRLLPRRCAKRGAAVVTVDHVTKAKNGTVKYALGAQHKRASVQGAAYRVEAISQPAPGAVGLLRLSIAKDRHGAVRKHDPKRAGEFEIDSTRGDRITCTLRAPATPQARGVIRSTHLMEQVSKFLEATPEGASVRDVQDGVPGRQQSVRDALKELVSEGFVERQRGAQNRRIHHSLRPYRGAEGVQAVSPERVPVSEGGPSVSGGSGRSPRPSVAGVSDPPTTSGSGHARGAGRRSRRRRKTGKL